MRSAEQIEAYHERQGDDDAARYRTACLEACLPREFWDARKSDVRHNVDVFEGVIEPYIRKWRKALAGGYGLFMVGDNGSGKSMFASMVGAQMIRRGCSVYYTTLPQFDLDAKRTFRDWRAEKRLTEMLDSDFVIFDEVGKGKRGKAGEESFLADRFETELKRRYSDKRPTILAANMSDWKAEITDVYGASVVSMIDGRFIHAALETGDFRKMTAKQMSKDMGI